MRRRKPIKVKADVRVLRVKKRFGSTSMSICELKAMARQSDIKLSKKVNGKTRPKNKSDLVADLVAAGIAVY